MCISIGPARLADACAIAQLSALREGGSLHDHQRHAELQLHHDDATCRMLIATSGDNVSAYGKTSFFDPPDDAPPDVAPRGWYLAGLIVHPEYRRHGIGLALTHARLAWIARRATRAFFFSNAQNLASIALHRKCGFVELTRDFVFPGISFRGGAGVLETMRLDHAEKLAEY